MAENIKHYLKLKNINVKDFAKQLGFKYTTVLDWVNAHTYPRIDKIEEMARYFNIDKSKLVERHDTTGAESDLSKMLKNVESYDGKPVTDNDIEAIRIFLQGRFSNR
ncbi:XRE family transcriptional regulator [Lactobacillus helveticus]|nr:XRE family transcriptional regulator [Lactobacillus helveticus]